eukprot:1139666-Pelagomonas_calceolata.AAC.1
MAASAVSSWIAAMREAKVSGSEGAESWVSQTHAAIVCDTGRGVPFLVAGRRCIRGKYREARAPHPRRPRTGYTMLPARQQTKEQTR